MSWSNDTCRVLVLGIGNVLMGDEGVGVYVVRLLEELDLPEDVRCLDGGTGSFQLLGAFSSAGKVVLVDATADGKEPGTVTRLEPRFSSDYPPSLTAHDIGLKDLLDSLYLLENSPPVTLFAVSIDRFQAVGMGLSAHLAELVPGIADQVLQEVHRQLEM